MIELTNKSNPSTVTNSFITALATEYFRSKKTHSKDSRPFPNTLTKSLISSHMIQHL